MYCYRNTGSNSNLNNNNTVTSTVKNYDIKFFLTGPIQESDREASAKITQLQRDSDDIFNGKGCFDGTFSLQLKPDSKPH